MKKLQKALLFPATTILFVFSIFLVQANAQCVQCTPAPPGWICTGTTKIGGSGCLPEGENCTLIGTCTPENDSPELGGNSPGKKGDCSLKILKKPLIIMSDSIIHDLSRANPRVALALINIRSIKAEFKEGKISFAPIELTDKDVEKQLTLPKSSRYFEERAAKIKEAFASQQEPIVYEFFFDRDDSANIFSLRISAVSPNESTSSFKFNLSKISSKRNPSDLIQFEVISWENN
jgi:hypothetical protein